MQINWDEWADNGGPKASKPLRQAVHIVLLSISKCKSLKDNMMLKGGILMALCYKSSRFTRDIDLSQIEKYTDETAGTLLRELEIALQQSVQEVDYGLDCKVQSSQLKPPSKKNPTFPVLEVKIGYAYNIDKNSHRRLMKGNSSSVLEIDFSFNETTSQAERFTISEGVTLLRYSIIDLVAEKFRALLQQETRGRYRGQDLHDIMFLLIKLPTELNDLKLEILAALLKSSKSKGLDININSMSEGKIKSMTKIEYEQLESSVPENEFTNFDEAYDKVTNYYKSLPW